MEKTRNALNATPEQAIRGDNKNGPTAQRTAKNGAPPDLNPITRTEHMATASPATRALSRTDCIAILASEDEALVRFKTGWFDLEDPSETDFSVEVVAAALERLRAKHEIAADVVADEDFAWDVSFEASEVYARHLAADAEDY